MCLSPLPWGRCLHVTQVSWGTVTSSSHCKQLKYTGRMRELFLHKTFYFKHNLTPIIILAMQKCSRFCHLLQGRELVDLCWLTQAEKVARAPSSHPFDLDRASHPELFSWSDSPHAVSHTHKKAQWLWDPSCCHHVILTELSTSRSFSTDHIQPQTLLAPTRDLSRLSPRQRLTRWPLGVHWSLSALKSMMSKTFTEPGSLQQTDPSAPSPPHQSQSKNRSSARFSSCGDAKGWKVKQRTGQSLGARSCGKTHGRVQPWWHWAELRCCAGSGQCQASLACPFHHDCSALGSRVQVNGMLFAAVETLLWLWVEQACVLLEAFSLPDKHWKDCTALYRGLPHHRAKQIHLWSTLIKVFHFTSSSWKTTLLGDGGVDFFFLWGFFTVFMCVGFLGFLLLFCWGFFVCFLGEGFGFCCLGFFSSLFLKGRLMTYFFLVASLLVDSSSLLYYCKQ